MQRGQEPKVEFKVWYKANPAYRGSFNRIKHEGLQGTFPLQHEADRAVEACKRWFNTEHYFEPVKQRDGSVVETPASTVHDNVIVWIEQYIDGVMVEESCEKELVEA